MGRMLVVLSLVMENELRANLVGSIMIVIVGNAQILKKYVKPLSYMENALLMNNVIKLLFKK